jgi:DNA-binding NarL/FixJ family response regulator
VRRTTLTALLMAGALALTACASDSAASEGAGDAGGNGGEEESQNDHDHGDPVTAEPLTQRHEFTDSISVSIGVQPDGRDEHRAALPAVGESLRASLLGPDVVLHAMWPVLLPLCLAVRDRDTAEEIGAVVANVADRAEVRSATAAGLHARGLLDDDPEPLLAAVEAYRDTPRLVDRTACHEAAGLALARRGQPDDAATHLQAAAESYEAMRAVRHLARVEAGLRMIGLSRGRRRSRTQPTTGWGSLTPTERSVAALVADGLVYREVGERLFISRRTVETHVANMFTKLDIASRAELAALVRRHAADPTTQ